MKKRMYKTVYIYTTDIKRQFGRFKVGKADRFASSKEEAAMIRINEQFTAGNRDEKIILIHVWDTDEVNMRSIDLESKLHAVLRRYNVGGEWFETKTTDPIFTAYNEIIFGIARPFNYMPRIEQEQAFKMAYEYYQKNGVGSVFLFNAIMRFGKCFTAYQLMKLLGAKKVLILTYKPSCGDSWATDLNHINFKEYQYFDARDFSTNSPIKIPKGVYGVLFSSFQDILGKDMNKRIKMKWKRMIQEHFDFVIIDEVHYGFSSKLAQEFISKLKYTYRLDLSGTPITLLNSGYYEKDQVFNWNYIDEQKMKLQYPDDPAYKWLPKLNMYTYAISTEIFEKLHLFNPEEYETLNKLFGADDKNTLKNDAAIEKFLDNLADPERRSQQSPYNDDKILKELKHSFWYLAGVNSIKAFRKKLEKHWFFKKYQIIVAAGDNDGEGSDALELVRDIIFKVDNQIGKYAGKVGTITLSCGKLNTGVGIKEWKSVFFLSDLVSIQTYWQAAFRPKTPDPENNKTDAYIFDFNPNRALLMAYSYAEFNAKDGESTIKTLRDFLETMNWHAYNGNKLEKFDIETSLSNIIRRGTNAEETIRKFSSNWLFDSSIQEDSVVNILLEMGETSAESSKEEEISSSFVANGKTYKITRTGEKEKKEGNDIDMNKLFNRARTITIALPTYLACSSEKEESANQILNSGNEEMFLDICRISLEEFKILIESGFIKKDRLNKAIESFNIMESNL